MTTRAGGFSAAPFESMNLGGAVGDDADARAAQPARGWPRRSARAPVCLRQVHGARVVRLGAADAAPARRCHDGRRQRHDRARHRLRGPGRRLPAGAVRRADGRASARRTPAGAAWPAACSRRRVARCARRPAAQPARRRRPGSAPASGRRASRSAPTCSHAFGAPARAAQPGALRRRAAPGKWLADLPLLARDRLAAAGVGADRRRPLVHASSDAVTVLFVPARPASPAAWPPPSGSRGCSRAAAAALGARRRARAAPACRAGRARSPSGSTP